MTHAIERVAAGLGTTITMQVVGASDAAHACLDEAFAWVRRVEDTCSRFESTSELRQLCTHVGTAVPVSPLLFDTLAFALAVAASTDGAFDPTLGMTLERLGFDTRWQDGQRVHTGRDIVAARASFRDVHLDDVRRTVRLSRPLTLDLGAVAKGLAVDLAAQALQPCGDFAIDAGGDVRCGGHNNVGTPWVIGVRDPRAPEALLYRLTINDQAVCTSGDYLRHTRDGTGHHLLDPRTGTSVQHLTSVTVVAPTAMLADALATAAFVLGPEDGCALLAAHGVEGCLCPPDGPPITTAGWSSLLLPEVAGVH